MYKLRLAITHTSKGDKEKILSWVELASNEEWFKVFRFSHKSSDEKGFAVDGIAFLQNFMDKLDNLIVITTNLMNK